MTTASDITVPAATRVLSPAELAEIVEQLACRPAEWVSRVRLDAEGRWYEQIHVDDSYELWLISWLPGHSTEFHDHGGANGAFSVVWGTLDEVVVSGPAEGGSGRVEGGPGRVEGGPRRTAEVARPVTQGVVRSFGPHYIHDVRNTTADSVAVSVHAYSPPLSAMTRYRLTSEGLVPVSSESQEDW
jgi:predicted metal-dependent enzyme (double-stranded beta helix superfamily)